MRHISNEDIKAACLPIPMDYELHEFDRVVYRLSDDAPRVEQWNQVPAWVSRSAIWGIATDEAERLVAERRRQFDAVWGR